VPTLAEETGYSQRTIQRSLLSLKRLGLIKIQHRFNQSNRYRIELDALARAVENAERERAERLRYKQAADADSDGWDDDPTQDTSAVEKHAQDQPEQDESDEDEGEEWMQNFNTTFFSTIDQAEDPRYLIAKIYPSSDPLYAQHTIMKTCRSIDEVRFVFENEFLCGYYGQDHSRYEGDWQDLKKHKTLQCVGFEIRLYDHYACEDLKP
jgi:hypothetical protein